MVQYTVHPLTKLSQAKRHNKSPMVTSKQTTVTPRCNERGEKKGEVEGETRANVKKS